MASLKARFDRLDPGKRRWVILGAAATAVFGVIAVLVTLFGAPPKPLESRNRRPLDYSIFNGRNPRELTLETLSGRVKRLAEDFGTAKQAMQANTAKLQEELEAARKRNEELQKRADDMNNTLKSLAHALEETKQNLAVPLPELPRAPRERPAAPKFAPPAIPDQDVPPATDFQIRVTTSAGTFEAGKAPAAAPGQPARTAPAAAEPARPRRVSERNKPPLLPSGSLLSGTLITGLDAPTAAQAKKDPFPALLRVKHEAILPNRFRMDVRECFLIASGYGDLSSERAYLRAEHLSCVRNDGAPIDVELDAYAVGEDGKAGVRGRLVSKNGQIIGNALLSGFISGISNAFIPQRVQSLNLSQPGVGTIPYQYPSPEMIGGQALAGGVKGAAQQIAEYYLEMAKNIFPVIEVDAGRKLDFILVKGAELKAGVPFRPRRTEAAATPYAVGFAPGAYSAPVPPLAPAPQAPPPEAADENPPIP